MPQEALSSLLYQLVERNDIAFIKSLLSLNCNVKRLLFYQKKDAHNISPLHLAAERGHTEAIKELLSHEASKPFIKDMLLAPAQCGYIPLHVAAGLGQTEAIKKLLAHKASELFIKDMLLAGLGKGHPTPLHVAAGWGQSEALQALLSHEASKSFIKDMLLAGLEKSLATPLHLAARWGKREALQALLTAGRAQNCLQDMLLMQDTEGKTPLSIAQHQDQHCPSDTTQEILSILSQQVVAPAIKEEVISNHHSTKRAADTDLGAQREAQRLCTGAASGKPVFSAELEANTLYPVGQGLKEAFCQIKNELGGQLSIG